jgi:bifunctional non-homologous end joining protein LigD
MARRSLKEYRSKRSPGKTPEPVGDEPTGADAAGSGRFVVQEHDATNLHWDLRLEHEGVAVSWALPKGVPQHPDENRLAVHTEDHPLKYLEWEGEIPKGEYGAGTMSIWDRGSYEAEKFRDDEVILTFAGERVSGRYALFQTEGKNWMIHRMDPPADAGREPMPESIEPMKAVLAELPRDDEAWGYEIKWDGVRAIAYCDAGHTTLVSRTGREITSQYPELRLGLALGSPQAILDGEVVAFDSNGRPDFQRLQTRMHLASSAQVKRKMGTVPVTYVAFDLLFFEGRTLCDLPYEERRRALERLELEGEAWRTPSYHRGDGEALMDLTREQGLEGIVAKRLDSRYLPGKRSRAWLKVKHTSSQDLVIGAWLPGEGRRESSLGALAVGYYEESDSGLELRYAGKVGTGFTEETLRDLSRRLRKLETGASPFTGRQPPKLARFVEPELVAEIEFREWTRARTLRAPSYKGLRDDREPEEVRLDPGDRESSGE